MNFRGFKHCLISNIFYIRVNERIIHFHANDRKISKFIIISTRTFQLLTDSLNPNQFNVPWLVSIDTSTKARSVFFKFVKMSKFNVLNNNQAFMTRLGLYSYRLTEPTFELFKSIVPYFMIICLALGISLSVMFVYYFIMNGNMSDLKPLVEALVVVIAGCQTLPAYLVMAFKINAVKSLHLKLQSVVDKGFVSSYFLKRIFYATDFKFQFVH